MSLASVVINVSDQPQTHSNGLSGHHIVPAIDRAKKYGNKPETFGMLVIYPTLEIQDIGEGKRTTHWLKARPLAMDIVGVRSDAAGHSVGMLGGASKERWGLLLCKAEPTITRELEEAWEAEAIFLNENPPDVKMRLDQKSKAIVAVNIEDLDIKRGKIELSAAVVELKAEFEAMCRSLVTRDEIERAKRNLLANDQRMVAEGDAIYARPKEHHNLNELHLASCKRLGQTRPWCYTASELVQCPGCGTMIMQNILKCPNCAGWLDDGVDVLLAMGTKERAQAMYPERIAEEGIVVGGKGK